MAETIELALLPDAARERYLRYAMSVITSRALPDVRDGLKPVQRRILYTMQAELGLGGGDARFQKCAGVVGRVMGDYHPHGDQAIYEALVRMAQDFSLRHPLVEGQGNFGTIDGDPPAAFRYTECRLQGLASELMTLLPEQTVGFRPSYDGRKEEPIVLPVPVPLLLVNGTTGIAVGMATNVPPHNLVEVTRAAAHLVDDPEASVADLVRYLKGPDFPTGGEVLCQRADLRAIYETGRGSFKLRGTYEVEEGERGARSLVITSVPYGTTLEAVIGAIAEIIRAKKVPHALDVTNFTNAADGVRIVVELKKDADPAELAAYLYKHTPLQANFGVNLTCLIPTENPLVGRPEVLDLKQTLRHFLDFRFEVVTRSLEFRLRKLRDRIHVLEGFVRVFDDLDNVIRLIRRSDDKADAQAKLMKKYGLDEVQTDAILELKLYRLAKLEYEQIQAELAEKRAEARRIEKLLAGPRPRWELIKKDLLAFGEAHGDKRRTRLVMAEDGLVYDAEAYIAKEDTNVVVTRMGLVKRVRELKDPASTRVREDDAVGWVLQGSTRAEGAFFSNLGSAYVAKINDAPATTGYGDPIQKLFKFGDGERLVAALSLDRRLTPPEDEAKPSLLLVATAQGNVLRVPLAPHRAPSTRAGRKLVRLNEGDEVVSVELVPPGARHVLLATRLGQALRFALDEVPLVAGVGKGQRGIKLDGKDRLVLATLAPSVELLTDRGARFKLSQKNVELAARGGEGVAVKERGGFDRAVLEPSLVPLEPEPDDPSPSKGEG